MTSDEAKAMLARYYRAIQKAYYDKTYDEATATRREKYEAERAILTHLDEIREHFEVSVAIRAVPHAEQRGGAGGERR